MNVTIIDVAPRDGLQNEPEILPVAVKVELVERLARAGLPRIEIGSFVNPKQVPQMAGTGEVATTLQGLEMRDWRLHKGYANLQAPISNFTALVPNLRGYELAAVAGLRHVRLVLAASESLNQANFKRSVADSLTDFATIAARACADGMGFGVAIGASFGCPFGGHVPAERVLALAHDLVALGADEIVLADTTGMAVPRQVRVLCERLGEAFAQTTPPSAVAGHLTAPHGGEAVAPTLPVPRVAGQAAASPLRGAPVITVHFHNTRNTGYANAYAALEAGITSFDAALGGIGGCPFAPKAVGNIASEDLAHMLYGMGVETGIDLDLLIEASNWLSERMGKPLPALVGKAGPVFTHAQT